MGGLLGRLSEDVKKESIYRTNELLSSLIQPEQRVGWVYSMSYDNALVLIHDFHKRQAGGIPGLSFLLATRKEDSDGLDFQDEDASVLLLRVIDSAPLPNAAEAEKIRIEAAQRTADGKQYWDDPGVIDPYTRNLLGWAALRCRILGTFYLERIQRGKHEDLVLKFGSDVSNFYSNTALKVYKPVGEALSKIVNYRDAQRLDDHPLREHNVHIGRVRYASTDRSGQGIDSVGVNLAPADLLNQKTALFGMTRTGKSNTTKIIASSVFSLRYADPQNGRIGQIIFDPNGEYANENVQDRGALKNVWKQNPNGKREDVVTYGTEEHENDPDRNLLKINFYDESMLVFGKKIIDDKLIDDDAKFVRNFCNVDFDHLLTSMKNNDGSGTRSKRVILAYRALLARAGFEVPSKLKYPNAQRLFGQSLTDAMKNSTHSEKAAEYKRAAEVLAKANNGQERVTWDQLADALATLGDYITRQNSGYKEFNSKYMEEESKSGKAWADEDLTGVLGMLAQRYGPGRIRKLIGRHSPSVSQRFTDTIVEDLHKGRLVIVDQSIGDPHLNQIVADQIMTAIFRKHQDLFSKSKKPPEILVYVEEAHNLLPSGSEDDVTTIWPRVAKEGAKLKIGLVYATQEVSGIQRAILKNTSNWFIAHLNNTDETRELRKYYDFADYESSILRAQDPGFLRVKTLSNFYVVPVQIKKFEIGD